MSEDQGSEPRDVVLIARAKRGEIEAYGQIYERYLDLIFRYVRARVSDQRDAEDLTEQVFLRSFESLERYEDRGWPFSAFLYRVARNVVVDHYRLQKEHFSTNDFGDLEDPAPAMEDTLVLSERMLELQRAMQELPPDYQEVIRLRILLELPTSTVAEWMGRKEGAIRVLLYRALKSLRQEVMVEDDGGN